MTNEHPTKNAQLTDRIIDIFSNESSFVASLNGVWGCGKTYYWSRTLSIELQERNIKPVYISLFGKESIKDIETEIVLQVIKHSSSISLKGQVKKLFDSSILSKVILFLDTYGVRKLLKIILSKFKFLWLPLKKIIVYVLVKVQLPWGIDLFPILGLLADDSFENVAICFDDFERLSEKVSYRDLIGLMSNLKEQKKAKILLIQNANAIDEKAEHQIKDVRIYMEKIIDYSFLYEPEAEDQFEIVKSKVRFGKEVLKNFIIDEKITNIRTINRLVNSVNDFEFIENYKYRKDIVDYFLKVLISMARVSIEDHFFEFDKIKFDPFGFGKGEDDKLSHEELRLNEIENKLYGVEHFDYDGSKEIISDYLRSSMLDDGAILSYFEMKKNRHDFEELSDRLAILIHRYKYDFCFFNKEFIAELSQELFDGFEMLSMYLQSLIYYSSVFKKVDPENSEAHHNRVVEALEAWLRETYHDEEIQNSYDWSETYKRAIEYEPSLKNYYNKLKSNENIEIKNNVEEARGHLVAYLTQKRWNYKCLEFLLTISVESFKNYILSSDYFAKNASDCVKKINKINDIENNEEIFSVRDNIIEAFEVISNTGNEDQNIKAEKILEEIGHKKSQDTN